MRKKIQQASELIFDIEQELSIDSDLRREGYRARIKMGEFSNMIYHTPEDCIPYRNSEIPKEKSEQTPCFPRAACYCLSC